VIHFLHYTENSELRSYLLELGLLDGTIDWLEFSGLIEIYQSLTGGGLIPGESELNFIVLSHISAMETIAYIVKYGDFIGPDDLLNEDEYGYLRLTPTAVSFILFLLERGGREDYLLFYADISRAGELYGKDLRGLTDEWLNGYLNINEWLDYLLEHAV
jgi:hypothetical protein